MKKKIKGLQLIIYKGSRISITNTQHCILVSLCTVQRPFTRTYLPAFAELNTTVHALKASKGGTELGEDNSALIIHI
jgi:hypothetical protein